MGEVTDLARVPEALRKTLRPRRRLEGSARPPKVASVLKWIAKTWSSKPQSHGDKSHAALFAAGLATKTDPALAKPRRAALALLERVDLAGIEEADIETLAVAERMVQHMASGESLAAAIAAARSLADAVETVLRAAHLTTESSSYTQTVSIVACAEPELRGEPCPSLRHLVCAAPEPAYDEARKRAEKLRKTTSPGGRAVLAYMFPDEPWGTESLREGLASANEPLRYWYLLSATTDPIVVREWLDADGAFLISTNAIDLALALPADAAVPIFASAMAKLLEKPAYGPVMKTPPRSVAQGLAVIDTPESAEALAPFAQHAILGPTVLAYFREHPERGDALLAQAKGKARAAAAASRVLGKTKSASPKRALAREAELPSVLRDRPWRTKTPRAKAVVLDLEVQGLDRAHLDLRREPAAESSRPIREMTKKEIAEWRARAATDDLIYADYETDRRRPGSYLRVPDAEGLAAWNTRSSHLAFGALAWVKRHGLAALPGFVDPDVRDWIEWLSYDDYDDFVEAALCLVSPLTAPTIASLAARRKRFRRVARAWLVEHAEIAALGLVPAAFSKRREAKAAQAALSFLARQGGAKAVAAAGARYGKAASQAVKDLLDRDPLVDGVVVPKMPDFLQVESLPAPSLRNGKVLDAEATTALVEMFAVGTLDDPYPGLALVREACEPASIAELATELLEQWVLGDAPGRHDWMLAACVHFPSERATRRLTELGREWARKDGAKGERACTALAALGSGGEKTADLALMHLDHIAETTRFITLQKTARTLLREAADARGLGQEELGDRTVPDVGLSSEGTMELSFGSRSFVVRCDSMLRPVVREKLAAGWGPPTTTLPRATKTDDATRAKEARERFERLKRDLDAIAARQLRRLERAMVAGRTWSVSELEERIIQHPLLRHLASALVWERLERGKSETFRVAEDGSYADAKDRPFELSPKARVRLAHPARTPDLGASWGTVFGDYEIVQPFEQLSRTVHVPTAKEKRARALERAGSIRVPARKLLGTMESRGWERDAGGHISAWLRTLGRDSGSAVVRWPITPPIAIDFLRDAIVVTEPLTVIRDGAAVPFGEIDDVGSSELLRDVEIVRTLE